MMESALVQVRMETGLKQRADELFSGLGFDTPTAIRIFLNQAVKRRGLPFTVREDVPNLETRKAMQDVRAGRNVSRTFDTVDSLMEDLLGEGDA
jgi:DNA-damage-inducible protein J